MIKKIFVASLLFAFSFQAAFALYETYGARPMGMGGAFTAIADDANAAYWNPAGLALNPEVSMTGSTKMNNRNTWMGDNVANLKMCYEADMNPFEWIAGIGLASVLAMEGAQYLSDQGVVKKGWGRTGETTSRDESMASQVKGSEEVVSLKKGVKDAVNTLAKGVTEGTKKVAQNTTVQINTIIPLGSPVYRPDYSHPHYWEKPASGPSTKAQFGLGLSWLNDYNPPMDQGTNWYSLSVASGFEQRVAVGANLNIYDLTKISTNIRGTGADLDLGVIVKPVEYISIGVTTKGILTTDIKWQSGDTTRYEMLVNAGIAVKPLPTVTIAADAHNMFRPTTTYHYGAEVVLLPGLLARGGLSDGSKTAGISLAIGNIILDYAYLGGMYNRTQMAGATWRF